MFGAVQETRTGRSMAGLRALSAITGLAQALAEAVDQQRDRWFLWVPVCLAAGIAGYFALPIDEQAPEADLIVPDAETGEIKSPLASTKAPPELPGLIAASVWIKSSKSTMPMPVRLFAETIPIVTV